MVESVVCCLWFAVPREESIGVADELCRGQVGWKRLCGRRLRMGASFVV